MPAETPNIVLFDVDGTLIRTEGPSRHNRAFRAAFQKVYGGECRFLPGMHGMTDLQIFLTLTCDRGLDDAESRGLALEACRTMIEIYERSAETDGRYVILPGALSTLETLARQGAVLGLLTGNAPEIARDKLVSVGLADFFTFGAYGTEADDRSLLPPLAISRAETLVGTSVDRNRVFVVGDTPRDVSCALDNGCRAVAVATGHIPMDDLLATGAHLVLPSLLEIEALLGLLKP